MPFFILSTSERHPKVARMTKGFPTPVEAVFPLEVGTGQTELWFDEAVCVVVVVVVVLLRVVCVATELLELLRGLVTTMCSSLLRDLVGAVVAMLLLVWRGLVEIVVVM